MADDGEQGEQPISPTGSSKTAEGTLQPESEDTKIATSPPAVVSETPVTPKCAADQQETDGRSSDEESDDSINDEPIILLDELVSLGTTGVHLKISTATPPGTNPMAVAVLVPLTFADRCGVRKYDWVDAVNGKTFTSPEDVCNFVKKCEKKDTVVSTNIVRRIVNRKTGSSHTEEFVMTRIYCEPNNVLLEERLIMYDAHPFQGWSTDEFYIRHNKNGFFVTVKNGKLTLQQEMKGIVFKVHTIIETRRDAVRPKLLVLEHKKSKLCVSISNKGVTLRPNMDEEDLSPSDARVLHYVVDKVGNNGGRKFKFKPYDRKWVEYFHFLDFAAEGSRAWKPVIIVRRKPKTAEAKARQHAESFVFTLFKKLE